MRGARAASAALCLLWATAAAGVPDLAAPRIANGLRFYPDHERNSLFYYAPSDLALAQEADGQPGLHFLQLRYVGTALYGNQGEQGSYSTLTLRIRMDGPTPAQLQGARAEIRRAAGRLGVELRPLPITRFDAYLVYASLGADAAADVVSGGHFEADDAGAGLSGPQGYWSERVFTVPMDAETSQLMWKLIHEGEVGISIVYSFFSTGVASDRYADVKVSGSEDEAADQILAALASGGVPLPPERRKGVGERLAEEIRKSGLFGPVKEAERDHGATPEQPREPARVTRLVHAGATGIRIDAKRWPDLFERVDFNEQAPPGYAALKVYCYDFADHLSPDLFYKKVEIEAVAVGGRRVPLEAKFLSSQPDLYARSVRFPVAIQVNQPFRYRVISAHRDGTIDKGEWSERSEWSRILDITARPGPDAAPGPVGHGEEG